MSLGYEVHEDDRDFASEDVKRYTYTDMSYPCYIVELSNEKPLAKFTLEVLKNMLVGTEKFDPNAVTISIYFSQGERTVKFGVIQARQAKTFLKLLEKNDVIGFFDKDTILRGDMLYVLSD